MIFVSVWFFLFAASILFSIKSSFLRISLILSSNTRSLPERFVSCSVSALGCSCCDGFEALPKMLKPCSILDFAGGGGIGGGGISGMVNVYIVSLFYML